MTEQGIETTEKLTDKQKEVLALIVTANIIGFSEENSQFLEDLYDLNGDRIEDPSIIQDVVTKVINGELKSVIDDETKGETIFDGDKKLYTKKENPISTMINEYTDCLLDPSSSLAILYYFEDGSDEVKSLSNQDQSGIGITDWSKVEPIGASRIRVFNSPETAKEALISELDPYLDEEEVRKIIESVELYLKNTSPETPFVFLSEISTKSGEAPNFPFMLDTGLKIFNFVADRKPTAICYYTVEGSSTLPERILDEVMQELNENGKGEFTQITKNGPIEIIIARKYGRRFYNNFKMSLPKQKVFTMLCKNNFINSPNEQ